jgi:Mg-chelatase subunit ChlD
MIHVAHVDDSGSMRFEENGERIKDLQLILQRVTYAATLFDNDGISVRFMNSTPPPHLINGIRDDKQVETLMQSLQYKGLTPMGTELRKRVIDELVVGKARSGELRKPVLVIVLTDGQPSGEPDSAIFDTIRYTNAQLQQSRYGAGAVAFQIAQVGNDQEARAFLAKMDRDPVIGGLVDCTSSGSFTIRSILQSAF